MRQTSIDSFYAPETQIKLCGEVERIRKVFEAFPENEMTAHEVAKLCTINYFIIQKRMSVLVRKGYIEECGVDIVNNRSRTKYKLKK